jgi:hypothetical protein
MKKVALYSLCTLLGITLFHTSLLAQSATASKKASPYKAAKASTNSEFQGFLYDSESSMGGRYNTNGWHLFYQKTKIIYERKKRFKEFEFGRIRHEKEVKTVSYFAGGGTNPPKNYVFGKQYSLYDINFRYGYSHLIAYKANRNGVAVSVNYSAGPSLGLLKPYYLLLYYSNPNAGINEGSLQSERFSEANQSHFLDPNQIYGYAGFFKGIFRTVPVPGISAKVGLNFDFSPYHDGIKAIEIGLMNNSYLLPTPVMIYTTNHKIWTSFYMSIQFGSRK